MEHATGNAATIACGLVIGKVAWGMAKNWWSRKTTREILVKKADEVISLFRTEDLVEESYDSFSPEDKITKRKTHKGLFRNYLVNMGKAKFGTPKDTIANQLCVRKYLYDICVDNGLLARHINMHLDIATAIVFVPSNNELVAQSIRATNGAKIRKRLWHELVGQEPDIA